MTKTLLALTWLVAAAQTPDFPNPITPPPVAPEMAAPNDLARQQVDVVPPPESELERDQARPSPVVAGQLIDVNSPGKTIAVATSAGEKTLQLSPRTTIRINGRAIVNLEELPPGEDVRAALDDSGRATRVDVTTRGWNGEGAGRTPVAP